MRLYDSSGETYSSGNGINDDDDTKNAHPLLVICLPLSPLILGFFALLIIFLKNFICLIIKCVNNKIEQVRKYLNNNEIIVNNMLSKKYIKKLNTENKNSCIDTTCSICLDNISNDGVTLYCKHRYHTKCLQRWVKQQITYVNNPTCPSCRRVVVEMSDKEEYSSGSDFSDFE